MFKSRLWELAFDRFDFDRSGSMDMDELPQLLIKCGLGSADGDDVGDEEEEEEKEEEGGGDGTTDTTTKTTEKKKRKKKKKGGKVAPEEVFDWLGLDHEKDHISRTQFRTYVLEE